MGFFGSGGDDTVLCMELMAIYHGLRLAWEHGFRKVLCLTDSLLSVSLIQTQLSQFHEYAVIVGNIKALLRREWEVRLCHTLREGNMCADFLAKAGARQDHSLEVLVSPPPGLGPLLCADAAGVSFIRS